MDFFSFSFLCLPKEKKQKKGHHQRQPKAFLAAPAARIGQKTFGSLRSWTAAPAFR